MPHLKESDINAALLAHVVDELEITVPVRSYEVVDGRLYLYLAYTLEPATWPAEIDDRPPVPAGDLSRFRKADLQAIARDRGLEDSQDLLKKDLVALLAQDREGEAP